MSLINCHEFLTTNVIFEMLLEVQQCDIVHLWYDHCSWTVSKICNRLENEIPAFFFPIDKDKYRKTIF